MTSQEKRWARWDDLRARQEVATSPEEREALMREEKELRADGIKELLLEDMDEPFVWWWLSFADGSLPEGKQFLGVAIVQAGGVLEASVRAKMFGCNPGGEVQGYPLPDVPEVPEEWREILLTAEECDKLNGIMKALS